MLLYSGYLIVLIIDAALIFPLPSPRPLRSSLHLPLSTCVATNPQLSSQQSPCQCEIEMWGNFSRPRAINSSSEKAPAWIHSLAHCWDQVFWHEAARSCRCKFNQPKPRVPPNPHSSSAVPSITATTWHALAVTSWLIAALAIRQRDMSDEKAQSSWVKQTRHVRIQWGSGCCFGRWLVILRFSSCFVSFISMILRRRTLEGYTSCSSVGTSQQILNTAYYYWRQTGTRG